MAEQTLGTKPVAVVIDGEHSTSALALHRDLAIGNFFVELARVARVAALLLDELLDQTREERAR